MDYNFSVAEDGKTIVCSYTVENPSAYRNGYKYQFDTHRLLIEISEDGKIIITNMDGSYDKDVEKNINSSISYKGTTIDKDGNVIRLDYVDIPNPLRNVTVTAKRDLSGYVTEHSPSFGDDLEYGAPQAGAFRDECSVYSVTRNMSHPAAVTHKTGVGKYGHVSYRNVCHTVQLDQFPNRLFPNSEIGAKGEIPNREGFYPLRSDEYWKNVIACERSAGLSNEAQMVR
jgi:hypothetical protein